MKDALSAHRLDIVLKLLDARLARIGSPPMRIVVCGGAAMIAMGLLSRTTTDVDIVALVDEAQGLSPPVPLPDYLVQAARELQQTLDLPANWLNNGPSRDEGGLFQMGLPEGFQERLHARDYGKHLTVYFIDRIDQIHFKLYASVDRGGYHISDLEALRPSQSELTQAARWTLTHDVSPEFRMLLKRLIETLGHEDVAEDI